MKKRLLKAGLATVLIAGCLLSRPDTAFARSRNVQPTIARLAVETMMNRVTTLIAVPGWQTVIDTSKLGEQVVVCKWGNPGLMAGEYIKIAKGNTPKGERQWETWGVRFVPKVREGITDLTLWTSTGRRLTFLIKIGPSATPVVVWELTGNERPEAPPVAARAAATATDGIELRQLRMSVAALQEQVEQLHSAVAELPVLKAAAAPTSTDTPVNEDVGIVAEPLKNGSAPAASKAEPVLASAVPNKQPQSAQPGQVRSPGSPAAVLATISIPLANGSTQQADRLLALQARYWNHQGGTTRRKLNLLVDSLLKYRDLHKALDHAKLSLEEVRTLIQGGAR